MDTLGCAININRSMKRSWYSTEAHLQSDDQVCTVSWLSQDFVQTHGYKKNKGGSIVNDC